MKHREPVPTQSTVVSRLVPWLPAQQCVSVVARVSRAAAGAVRQAFEVVVGQGEDLRPLLATRVPDFGTLRVPAGGCVLTGAINDPLCRSVRIAPLAGGRPPSRRVAAAPHVRVELHRDSLYGLVEFRCARLCLEGLLLCGRAASEFEADATQGRAKEESSEDWALLGALPLRISVDSAVVTCRSCTFEAELRLTLPRCDRVGAKVSLVEGCSWSCSSYQGLIICGIRPEQGFFQGQDDPELEDAFTSAGLTALRTFAGELDVDRTRNLIVPNGLRLCVVRNCEARDVRQHALLLRWDVCVLVERCALHGKVLIEEGPTVELRRNQHLVLDGEQLDPEFIGTLRSGRLEELPPEARAAPPRRRASKGGARRKRLASATTPDLPSVPLGDDTARLRRGRSLTGKRATWAPGGGSLK